MKSVERDVELMTALMECAHEIKSYAAHPMATVGEEKILTSNALIISAIVGMMTDLTRIKHSLGLYEKPEARDAGAKPAEPEG